MLAIDTDRPKVPLDSLYLYQIFISPCHLTRQKAGPKYETSILL